MTLGAKLTIPVTWPQQPANANASTANTVAGSGNANIWILQKLTGSGGNFTGTAQVCNLALPDITVGSVIGALIGGTKIQIQIPPAEWSKSATFTLTATAGGCDPSSSYHSQSAVALTGLNLPSGTDPGFAWPSTAWTLPGYPSSVVSGDQSSNPGLTATPLSSSGYVLPPTDGLATAKADKVYVVLRNQFISDGTIGTGTVTPKFFDNHVVACHVNGGSACTTGSTSSQAGFLDTNRTVFAPQSGASYKGVMLPSSADCAAVLSNSALQ